MISGNLRTKVSLSEDHDSGETLHIDNRCGRSIDCRVSLLFAHDSFTDDLDATGSFPNIVVLALRHVAKLLTGCSVFVLCYIRYER